jgi:hypothetical protein
MSENPSFNTHNTLSSENNTELNFNKNSVEVPKTKDLEENNFENLNPHDVSKLNFVTNNLNITRKPESSNGNKEFTRPRYEIPERDIRAIEYLKNSGKLNFSGYFQRRDDIQDIKDGHVHPSTVKILMELGFNDNYENIEIGSIYRPTDPAVYHPNGLAIDIVSIKLRGQPRYTHTQALRSGNAQNAFYQLASDLRDTRGVYRIVTAGSETNPNFNLADRLRRIPGMGATSSPGSVENIRIGVTPNLPSVTMRHEDHFHVDVSQFSSLTDSSRSITQRIRLGIY